MNNSKPSGNSALRRGVTSLLLLCATTALAEPTSTIHIPRIDSPPALSDFEDMRPSARVAGQMLRVTGFIAREPSDGAKPTQDTDVYLAYDRRICMQIGRAHV